MKAFEVSIYPELDGLGSIRVLEGTWEEASYTVGGQEFSVPAGITYNIKLTNTGEAVLLEGTASAEATTQCARCLEPATVEVEGEVQGYYLFEHVDEVEGMEADEYDFVSEQGTVDVSGPILGALVHETPFVVLCTDDCKGLCPTCGANLNEGPCSCDDDDIDPDNPFAALKDFKFD